MADTGNATAVVEILGQQIRHVVTERVIQEHISDRRGKRDSGPIHSRLDIVEIGMGLQALLPKA